MTGSSHYVAVFTSVDSRAEARRLAAELVRRGLVACAQISAIESFYAWQGEVQHEPEYRLLLKTTAARRAAVQAAIEELHGYELPAIYSVALAHLPAAFAAWVDEQTGGTGRHSEQEQS